MQQLTYTTQALFSQIEKALKHIDNKEYSSPNKLMDNATIGQHVRHIIELFQEMRKGYRSGEINYENRQRNFLIETDILFAVHQMKEIAESLETKDKCLQLVCGYDTDDAQNVINLATTYLREVIYNIEHTIHHMALIRIAFKTAFDIELEASFGVAPSTIKYRKACAQ